VANNFTRPPSRARATASTHRRWRTKKGPGEEVLSRGESVSRIMLDGSRGLGRRRKFVLEKPPLAHTPYSHPLGDR